MNATIELYTVHYFRFFTFGSDQEAIVFRDIRNQSMVLAVWFVENRTNEQIGPRAKIFDFISENFWFGSQVGRGPNRGPSSLDTRSFVPPKIVTFLT